MVKVENLVKRYKELIKIFHPELSLRAATDESQPEGELYYYTQLE